MAEYINKAELLNKRPEWLNTSVWNKEKSAHNNGWNDCNDEWLNTITEMPTIDIVHCKECKYADTQPFRMDSREKEARNLFCGRTLKYVDMDWFCADGERR